MTFKMSQFYKMTRYLCKIHIKKSLCCTTFRRCGHSTIGTIFIHCLSTSVDKKKHIEFPDSKHLSHEQLIHHACTATVNSSCQLLTSTLVALIDIGQKYRKALEDQMSLIEESLSNIGNENLQEELTDLTTAARSRVDMFKRSFMELNSLMDYVEKLVNAATETSYLAGAETACIALSERLHSAKVMIAEQQKQIKKLEEELVELQQKVITKSHEPSNKKD